MATFRQQVARRSTQTTVPRRVSPQRIPSALSTQYLEWILADLDRLRAEVRRKLLPILPKLAREAAALRGDRNSPAARNDAPREVGEELAELRLGLRGKVSEKLTGPIQVTGQRTAEANARELHRQIKSAIGIEVPLRDPVIGQRLATWTEENIALITSIEERFLGEVENTVLRGLTAGDRWEQLADAIEDRFDVSESRAELIARDQVGKFYGAVQQARQEELGVVAYFWRTSQDERVRPEHAAREGRKYQWTDAPEDGHPGEPVLCRCTAEPDLTPLIE